jgi:transcriptional regulator of aromatic amino acid metabolism
LVDSNIVGVLIWDLVYRENLALRDEVDRAFMFEEIVGSSKTLKTALSRIASVAPTDSTVFISGETGTGKELNCVPGASADARFVPRRVARNAQPSPQAPLAKVIGGPISPAASN